MLTNNFFNILNNMIKNNILYNKIHGMNLCLNYNNNIKNFIKNNNIFTKIFKNNYILIK